MLIEPKDHHDESGNSMQGVEKEKLMTNLDKQLAQYKLKMANLDKPKPTVDKDKEPSVKLDLSKVRNNSLPAITLRGN
jgi:hypothetical protein